MTDNRDDRPQPALSRTPAQSDGTYRMGADEHAAMKRALRGSVTVRKHLTRPAQSDVERANAAWVDYEPPEKCSKPHILIKHAFVSGFVAAATPPAGRVREVVEPLLRFHETGGHEGDGSDERLALIRTTLGVSPTVEGGQ